MINTPTIDSRIITLDNIICTNIDIISAEDRGFSSQNILSQLRKLVEHVDLKIYFMDQGKELEINQDKDLMQYYEKIVKQVESVKLDIQDKFIDVRYYIQKVKPIFINSKIYYELTLSTATDTINKFDRITVFSKVEIISNYAIKLSYVNRKVEIFNNKIDVKILTIGLFQLDLVK